MYFLLSITAFLGVGFLVFLIGRWLMFGVRNRLPEASQPLGRLTSAFAGMLPVSDSFREKLSQNLLRAGYYRRHADEAFLAVRNAALTAHFLLLASALAVLDWTPQETTWLLGVGGAVLVLIFALPRLVLESQAKARLLRIERALPDALDMINMMVVGGSPVRRAIQRVGRDLADTHPDLACELTIVDRQTEAGSQEQALQQFAKRIDAPDVTALAALVGHAERLGGNVASAFRDYADSIRRSRRQRAEERGNKAAVKLLFPVVFCLAPPIYILLLGPAALELRNFVNQESRPGGALSQTTVPVQSSEQPRD